jgi:NAD(P)H-dependent FMN reductase
LLKNTLDWVSRPHGVESGLIPYQGKWAGLVSASAGNLGGLRGLRHVREILTNLQVLVIPQQMALSQADKALLDPASNGLKGLAATGRALTETLLRWKK